MREQQSEALRLAEWLECGNRRSGDAAIAAELRRLDEVNSGILDALHSIMEMNVRGHQLQDRLQFSDAGRAILGKAKSAIDKAEKTK